LNVLKATSLKVKRRLDPDFPVEKCKERWGRTTVKAWQLRIYAKNSPVFLAYSDVFGTKKGGLRKKHPLERYQVAFFS